MTLSTLSSSTSFMSLHRPSVAALASSNSFFSSSVSSILSPSFVAEMSFLPSYSLSCYTAYSSIGSTMYSTSIPFFLRRSRNGEFSTTKKDLKGAQEELDAALAYYDKLKPSCVDAGVSYEERVKRREAEIQSLQEAL